MVLMHSSMIPLGSTAPDFKLKGAEGTQYSLSSFESSEVLVVIFMCNHCPYVQAIWDDLVNLDSEFDDRVQFVGINSNANMNYPEDSFEKMSMYAEERGQKFPYLYDEFQEASKAYDAQCTPDIFVFNSKRELAYRGSIEELKLAIDSLLLGEQPKAEQKASMGCSIKWTD